MTRRLDVIKFENDKAFRNNAKHYFLWFDALIPNGPNAIAANTLKFSDWLFLFYSFKFTLFTEMARILTTPIF